MTGKMATDSRITRLSALTSLEQMNSGTSVSHSQNPFLSPQSDSNKQKNFNILAEKSI